MTHGHKWRIFVLYLSFAGWFFLGILALVVGVFFLMPYITATQTELCYKLRDVAIQNGVCTPAELNLSAQ